jgi:ABC-type transport system involved in multi-copper enzyme maturation permease subunit
MILPVAERELRVATRRKSTYRLRIWAALVALLIGAGSMLLQTVSGLPPASLGDTLFTVLTWMGFVTCIASGAFFTSDCLSEEKREGTLGLLFLTDLRGFDIVSGKLMATSLRAFSALLAMFPVLAITLLMGSVGGGQFVRAALSLLAALMCSLAAGMFVSAISKDSQKALWGTVTILLFWLFAGPLFGLGLQRTSGWQGLGLLALTSPGYAFTASRSEQIGFWASLGVVACLALLLLGVTSFLIRRTWQDRPPQRFKTKFQPSRKSAEARRIHRSRFLDRNPVMWLVLKERSLDLAPWGLALAAVAAFGAMLTYAPSVMWMAWNSICGVLVLVLYVWTAAQAPRMLIEARRSGLLDLVLSSPLTVREIVRGHWLALARLLGWPALLLVLAQVAGTTLAYQQFWIPMYQQSGQGTGSVSMPVTVALSASLAVLAGLATMANLMAMCWFGMWMGLTSKSTLQAALKVLVFVQLVPSLVISFVSGIVTMLLVMPAILRGATNPGGPAASVTIPLLMALVQALLSILKDLGFILWSRKRLHSRLRPVLKSVPLTQTLPPVGMPPVIRLRT